jgi:hypothetical protein
VLYETILSVSSSIEIIRIHHTFNFLNTCVMKRELKLTMFIPKDVSFYVYPLEGYLPDLRITNKNGDILTPLPYQSLSRILGQSIDITTIRQFVARTYNIAEEKLQDYENFTVIEFPQHGDCYEELTFTWLERIESRRKHIQILNLFVPLTLRFPATESSTYVDLRIDEKYELIEKPNVSMIEEERFNFEQPLIVESKKNLAEDIDYSILLGDKRHYVFRFPRNLFQIIYIDFRIAIPLIVRVWSGLGMAIGVGVIIASILFTNKTNLPIFSTLSGGTIAGLIALRILLFHDVELLKWWHIIYIILILLILAITIMRLLLLNT